MSQPSLPAKLRRRLEGGVDPVSVFRELVGVPCVTFSEYLVYGHIKSVLDELRAGMSSIQMDRLAVNFTPAGQLLVSWRGRAGDPRKCVLVAHVDREGFLVTEIDHSAGTAVCWHTSAEKPDEDKMGSPVKLICPDCTLTGSIREMSDVPHTVSSTDPFDHKVVVRIDRKEGEINGHILKNRSFIGIGHYDIPPWNYSDGVIAATHVDNTAGVSVVMSVMMAVVRNNWRVNADFLFTTCEEAGFCGVTAEILNGSHLKAEKDGEVICIVVDSSSHTAFLKESSQWDPETIRDADPEQAVEIVLQSPVIRTGDRYTLFDPEVTRLLYAAAANLQGASGKSDRVSWAGRQRKSLSENLRSTLKTGSLAERGRGVSGRGSVQIGRMVGGWCEATPLQLESEIRERRGESSLKLRAGSVAIPTAAYRNSFKNRLQPEKCHEDALRGACQILGEAVRLCHRWPFGVGDRTRAGSGPMRGEIVDKLLGWQERFAGLSSVTKDWIVETNKQTGRPYEQLSDWCRDGAYGKPGSRRV